MFIVNGGLPRSGTVLVGTIVMGLLRRAGLEWNRLSPQERRDMPAFAEAARTWPGRAALVVHTHLITEDVLEALAKRDDAVLIWNHRDPRDAVVSLRRLHDLTLDHALKAMVVALRAEQMASASGLALRLRYETLIADVPGHVHRIAGALGLNADAAVVDAITAETSVARHRAVMAAVADGTMPGVRAHQTRHRVLREDPVTLINDRHIQSGRQGRWRKELTEAEQAAVARQLAHWTAALGYGA